MYKISKEQIDVVVNYIINSNVPSIDAQKIANLLKGLEEIKENGTTESVE